MFPAAYRPVSPRALATLMQDTPFPTAQMRAILVDNAYSPANVNFLLQMFEYNAVKAVRNSYVAQAETAYQHGVLSDDELNQILGGLGWSNEAINYVIQRAALQRRVTLAAKVEAQIVPLVAQGSVSRADGEQQLEAAGIQPWYADLEMTLAETKATIHAAKLEAAAERKLVLEQQRNLTKAAISQYQDGVLDAAGLTAALTTIGLEASLIVSIVAVQTALRTGKMKLVYGQLLSPTAAKLLNTQVAAIEAQVRDQVIPWPTARTMLEGLKIDAPEINALLSRWAASIAKSPGPDVDINPITGALLTKAT